MSRTINGTAITGTSTNLSPMITGQNERPEADAVAELALQLGGDTVLHNIAPSVSPLIVLPTGKRVESLKPLLDQYRATPERRSGKAHAFTRESFVDLVNRLKIAGETVVFANPKDGSHAGPSFLAVFDYHPETGKLDDARWGGHRASFVPRVADEWKLWTANNGKQMTQDEFARFIEDRITDIVVPNLDDPRIKTFADLVQGAFADPSEVLAFSRGLQLTVEQVVRNAVNTQTGEVQVIYNEQHAGEGAQQVKAKSLFQIAVPVFYAGALYRLAARLRYRVQGGRVSWHYQLVRPDLAFDDAFNETASEIAEQTNVPVILGAPES